tara:strand:- start:7681 stop:8463 length:783 start_codon:yes stop_codon:yes gene_type:complete
MGLNLDAIKAKLNQLNNNNDRRNNLWKPEAGKTRVRIVPYVHRKDNPFLELYFHYDIAKRSMLSPVSFGNADPVVEFAEKLKKTGDKDEWLMGRKIEPKMRTYVPVIVRGKESEGVKFWGFGKTIYTELLSIVSDPDYGDITDLLNGRDIDVEFTPAEGGGYPKTAIRVKPNTSAATEDKSIAEKIMNQPTITDIFPEPTYEELEQALKDWMNPDDDSSDVSTSSSSTTDAPSTDNATTETKTEEKQTDVASAFNDLFNK